MHRTEINLTEKLSYLHSIEKRWTLEHESMIIRYDFNFDVVDFIFVWALHLTFNSVAQRDNPTSLI